LFVCLFVFYTNLHFWTNLNQTLHTSCPWFRRDRRMYMDPQYSTFSTSSVGGECRILGRRWLPAQESLATALYPWLQHVLVWRHGHDVVADCSSLWVMHKKRGEVNGMHVCKNGNLMRQEGSE
jgi:hypothetical protein